MSTFVSAAFWLSFIALNFLGLFGLIGGKQLPWTMVIFFVLATVASVYSVKNGYEAGYRRAKSDFEIALSKTKAEMQGQQAQEFLTRLARELDNDGS